MTAADRPAWRGVNHLALVTDDMDATVRFYHGVLGAPLVATIGTESFRHYFFAFGRGTTIAFFEYGGLAIDRLQLPAGVPDARKAQFDHLALDVPDEAALLSLRSRLVAHGCEVTEVVDHRIIHSIYFTDPNGIALEASWWVQDVTGDEGGYDDASRFGDPDPVPAVRELLATGALTGTLPRTTLA